MVVHFICFELMLSNIWFLFFINNNYVNLKPPLGCSGWIIGVRLGLLGHSVVNCGSRLLLESPTTRWVSRNFIFASMTLKRRSPEHESSTKGVAR